MRGRIATVHKYLSLTLALLWLIQAATGTLIAFRWELEDWWLGGEPAALDLQAFSDRIQAIEDDPRYTVSSIWSSGGEPNRFDLFVSDETGGDRVIRITGAGDVLHERTDELLAEGAIFGTATSLHASLFADAFGHWLIALSGFLLVTNIILGLRLAWPKAKQWRRALLVKPAGAPAAKLYGWHRMVGLWFAFPAIVIITMGGFLALSDSIGSWLPSTTPPMSALSTMAGEGDVSPAKAVAAALALHPDAELSGIYMPGADQPYYIIRLLTPEEPAQIYGKTAVYVSDRTGEVLADQDARQYPAARRTLNMLFPLHTGQILGLPGRILGLLTGIWLMAMILLGISLFWRRRKK